MINTKEFTLLMALLMSVVAISIDAFLPALGSLGRELGVTNANQMQLMVSFIFAGMAFGELIAGPLSDAIGRKPVLYIGLGFYLAGSICCYVVHDFDLLLVGRLIQGFGAASPYTTVMSVVRDKYKGRDMARIMSLVMMIFILAPALAPSLGQAVLHFAGWRAIFLLYIIYSIAIGLWVALRLEETLPVDHRMPMQWRAFVHGFCAVITNRTTLIYMIATGLCFASLIAYVGASPQIFQNQFGVGEKFPLYFGGLALVLGVSSFVNSYIVARLGMRRICLYATAATIIASIVFLLLHLWLTITLPMFLCYAAILFFSFGLMFGNLNAIAMEPMGEVAGMAAAIIGAVSSIISMGLATVIGQLYNNTLIPIAGGFLILGVITWLFLHLEQIWHQKAAA